MPAEDGTPETGTETGLPGLARLRRLAQRPLATTPFPRASSARGRLVDAFPRFLGPVPASAIETSSLSPAQSRLQVALVGSTSREVSTVLRTYRVRLVARGMVEREVTSSSAGSETAAFARGRSTVTVTASREGDRTTYSVFGVLHAAGG
jgi:hypothetical protein